jgi:uncharacterized membrane protein YphA (DoxX/SURF4 family)
VNSVPRQTQLAVGPLVAAVGAVLLIVSLFLDWYEGLTGFTVFEFIDLLLVLLALATIASLAAGLGVVRPAPSPAVALGVALFTLFVILTQIINDPPAVVGPDGQDQDIGIWLALSGSALMVAGAVLGYASISLAFEPRSRRGPDDRDRDVSGAAAAPGSPPRPDPEPRRPVAFDDDPTRPLSDPAAPRRPDDPGARRDPERP